MNKYVEVLDSLVNDYESIDRPVFKDIKAVDLTNILDLKLTDQGCSLEVLHRSLKDFMDYSPDVSQTGFHKQLYSGVNEPALLGEWVASLTNSVMHTYKMGPVATLMELEVIRQLNKLVGFEKGEGIMVSGASQANLIAMMLARHRICPQLKKEGYQGRSLVAFVSDQAHYSMQRAANIIGIGENNLIAVNSDENGKMDPENLRFCIEKSIEQGKLPFFIGLTAGTTVIGSFDPVMPCNEIAKFYGLWLHIDGAWGAPILFSERYKDYLSGCDQADSFTWDAHKLMNVPLTAGVILTRETGQLKDCVAGGGGNYLFHQDENSAFNMGELSIQSARRADCLKLWSSWKSEGTQGYLKKIETLQNKKSYFVELLDKHPKFSIIAPSPFLNVLFQFKPSNQLHESELRALNVEICKLLAASGGAFIDYACFKGRTGIRAIFANEDVSRSYMDELLMSCEKLGTLIYRERSTSIASVSENKKQIKSDIAS